MKSLHLPSYLIGLLCGALIFVAIGFAGGRFGGTTAPATPSGNTAAQGRFGGGQGQFDPAQRNARMAERFGMTADELQKELDAGKTMQQIAEEHGVEMPSGGFGPRGGSGSRMGRGGSGSYMRDSGTGGAVQNNR